jgi:hypothetical protein
MSSASSSTLAEQARVATLAAIRISLAHCGVGTAPENIVRHLRQFDLEVTIADVTAVKAEEFVSKRPQEAAPNGAVKQAAELAPDMAWREAEATASPLLQDAQRLLSAAGSAELAKHSLEVAEQEAPRSDDAQEVPLPPDDVPPRDEKA